jgi:hypothetical protein
MRVEEDFNCYIPVTDDRSSTEADAACRGRSAAMERFYANR